MPKFLTALFAVALSVSIDSVASAELIFSCEATNDLYAALVAGGNRPARYDTPAAAIEAAPAGSGVLILAKSTEISSESLKSAREKKLRLFVENPKEFPGVEFGEGRTTNWERVVVAGDALKDAGLPKLRILTAHQCTFRPAKGQLDPLLVIARVAGNDMAVYGLPIETFPLLFRTSDGHWISSAPISSFISARYAPSEKWTAVWREILTNLDASGKAPKLVVEPAVRPSYSKADSLPKEFERDAVARFATWIDRSGLLISAKRNDELKKLIAANVEITDPPPAESKDEPRGDGTFGILEGFASSIRADGQQLRRTPLRADCNAESAMALALESSISGNERSRAVAKNLLDFIYFKSILHGGVRADPKHPAYGLIAWGAISPAWECATYGDDEARVLLASIVTGACLKSDAWDESMLRALLANLRTTGKFGFRGDRIDIGPLEHHGWRFYHDAETVNYALNFEAYLWACYLWAYHQTGEQEFLEKARAAISMTMKAYPDHWRWADNMERARILLPLAWLVRVDDKPEHRAWLQKIANDLIATQDACGAISENLGTTRGGGGHYVVPKSNEAYGTTETPLIQKNGDPISDQLYTTGFALIGLHEANALLNDPKTRAAEDKLAEYLARIQARSSKVPYLDGSWFRAFDFNQWDYWASSADIGWGAWSVEAGWCPTWVASTLALRVKNTTMWEMTADSRIEKHLDKVKAAMH